VDYATLSAAADFDTVFTGLLAVGAAVAGLYVAIRGARVLLGFIRR